MQQKLKTTLLLASALMLLSWLAPGRVAAQNNNSDLMLVLPFENVSAGQTEYNWVGESFADALSELLNVPGLRVVSSEQRENFYRNMNLPLASIPSRATTIKMARENGANLVVAGKYNIFPAQDDAPATLQVTARVVRVNEGRMAGKEMPDGHWAWNTYDVNGVLTQLQNLHGRLAYHILYNRDKALPFSQLHFVGLASKVPQQAFEFYIKGVQTRDLDKREKLLKAAESVYAKEKAGEIYTQAAFALGELYFSKQDWRNAADYFSKIDRRDRQYVEASFKAATCFWHLNDTSRALAAIVPLTLDAPLTSVYNNAGAISLQAARNEKDPAVRKHLLEQALRFLQRGAEHSTDPTIRFNYAHALFSSGKFEEAAPQFQRVYQERADAGYAYFLYAKSLEQTNQTDKAAPADDQAKRLMGNEYARWQEEWTRSRTVSTIPIGLQNFNREYLRPTGTDPVRREVDPQDLLGRARELYQSGRDEESLAELRRVVTVEPMNAQAYLLIGLIHQRQANLDQAVSALKTALFWDSKIVEAHVMLGKIYLQRNDCQQAKTHSLTALALAPNDAEALALKRSIDTGGCK